MIKVVISHGKESHQIEAEGPREQALIGKKIGDQIDGDEIGIPGYTFELTGGSDSDGFPMRSDVDRSGRSEALLSGGEGFNPSREGERRRKTVHGNTVDGDVVQANMVVTREGGEPLLELISES